MNLQLSSVLAITSDSVPPMQLVEQSMLDPASLTADQKQQVIGFSAVLTAFQNYASGDDINGVKYISKYYSYFCDLYAGYSLLPEGAQPSFQVANFSAPESFMGQAYSISGCAQNYFDL